MHIPINQRLSTPTQWLAEAWDATILHLDMDAFYLSVELLDKPHLKGVPAVVGGKSRRSVVTSASYEARRYGIRSAMPVAHAQALYPRLVILPNNREKYLHYSQKVMQILRSVTPLVEQLSIDEAFLDVAGARRLFGSPAQIAMKIKQLVYEATALPATVGVAGNKSVAKIVSTHSKPDGLGVVPPGRTRQYLDPMPVEVIWGVGPKMKQRLLADNIVTVADLAQQDPSRMQRKLGQVGPELVLLARGEDPREVEVEHEAKSVSVEKTFDEDVTSPEDIKRHLLDLSYECARRTRIEKVYARGVSVKVKDQQRAVRTRSIALKTPTDSGQVIYRTALKALQELMATEQHPIRLLGVRSDRIISETETLPTQTTLFATEIEDAENQQESLQRTDTVLDSVRAKFPEIDLRPATLVDKPAEGDKKIR